MRFRTAIIVVVSGLVGAALAVLVMRMSEPDAPAKDGAEDAAADAAAEAAAETLGLLEQLEETLAQAHTRLDGMDAELEALRLSVDGLGEGVRGLADTIDLGGSGAVEWTAVTTEVAAPEVVESSRVASLAHDLLASTDEAVRFPAATGLGRSADPEGALPALVSGLCADEHFMVRRACARSLGTLRAWYAVPALIEALEDREGYVAQQASHALREITGEDFGVTHGMRMAERSAAAERARIWWDGNHGSPPDGVSLAAPE